MTVKRKEDYTNLERLALGRMYQKVRNDPKDGKWRRFEEEVPYIDGIYLFSCHYRFNGDLFSVADLEINQVSGSRHIITGVQ